MFRYILNHKGFVSSPHSEILPPVVLVGFTIALEVGNLHH